MKKIFVTVAEFLENGGVIKKGRDIYEPNNGNPYVSLTAENDIPDFSKNAASYYLIQIDCTPIYV